MKRTAAPSTTRLVPIVGIGASAGGLAAVTSLLRGLPANPGVSVVVVQHLSPTRGSALPALLASASGLAVQEARDGVPLEPDQVYVVPPNAHIAVEDGRLRIVPRPEGRLKHSPIDVFFRSMAHAAGENTIGILLSGSSSDGVAGLRDIKVAGGTTLVQSPETAEFDAMPRAAIAAGVADLVLGPEHMGATLLRMLHNPLARARRAGASGGEVIEEQQLRRVFGLLRGATGVDFSHYKAPTIRRRLLRRMLLNKHDRVEGYVRQLEEQPSEVQNLYHDLLIQVTRFFREPESYQALRERVFPMIVKGRPADQPIRVWVPGCSTGEEAYSVAIELVEHLGESAGGTPVQIFATDVSDRAVERARAGVYPAAIAEDVSPQRLRRFFVKSDGGYRVNKTVRDMCVFARQDLTRDPPFSKLDLIVCRNVLIYLDPVLHRKLMNVFQYALKPDRFLVLGRAESTGPHGDLFTLVDKKFRVYRRKASGARMDLDYEPLDLRSSKAASGRKHAAEAREGGVQTEAVRLLLNRFAPPAVIVDNDLHIVHARGQTGPYLELAPGDASLDLLKMARQGLLFGLRAALSDARKTGNVARKSDLRVKFDGHVRSVNVEVVPLAAATAGDRHYMVLFEEVKGSGAAPAASRGGVLRKSVHPSSSNDEITAHLQQELAASREYLQSIIQDLEATNEELQSANEEVLSSNEELQSTNEELDTAKEELQSTNEEINTVNEELQARNEELSRANSDLLNLLSGVQIAIVFLTSELRIRRFTPMAEKVLNLIASDVGRPIGNIRPNIECPDLEQLIHDVVDSVTVKEREVRDKAGNWYLLRIRPYKSLDNRIDGAVIVLLDIDAVRRQEERLRWVKDYADAIFDAVHDPLVVLDGNLKVRRINRAFNTSFGDEGTQIVGKPLGDASGPWSTSQVRSLIAELQKSDGQSAPITASCEVVADGKRLWIDGHRIPSEDGHGRAIVLAIRPAS